MYVVAHPYKCLKCDYEFLFSPHDHHSAPLNSTQDPVCPKCWDALLESVGMGACTVIFGKGKSEYDTKKGN